jgi:hypothetical protein
VKPATSSCWINPYDFGWRGCCWVGSVICCRQHTRNHAALLRLSVIKKFKAVRLHLWESEIHLRTYIFCIISPRLKLSYRIFNCVRHVDEVCGGHHQTDLTVVFIGSACISKPLGQQVEVLPGLKHNYVAFVNAAFKLSCSSIPCHLLLYVEGERFKLIVAHSDNFYFIWHLTSCYRKPRDVILGYTCSNLVQKYFSCFLDKVRQL